MRQRIYLGDEKFVERMQKRVKVQGDELNLTAIFRGLTAMWRCKDPTLQTTPFLFPPGFSMA